MGCAQLSMNCSVIPDMVQADLDIAGIGVILSFLITACLSIVCCLLLALAEWTTIGIHYQQLERNRISKSVWIDFLRKNLLAFSDFQLITGIGIQISSYIKWCSISLYHFRIIACLALLSTVTHFLTLVFLREYFWGKRVLRNFRLLCMTINFLFMIHTIVLVLGFDHKKIGWASPPFCFYEGAKKAGTIVGGIVGALVVFASLGLAFATLVLRPRNSMNTINSADTTVSSTTTVAPANRPRAVPLIIIGVWVGMPIYVIAALIIAPLGLSATDALGKPLVRIDPPDGEKAWGFGQILPLFLLFVPFLAALEIFYDSREGVQRASTLQLQNVT